MFHIGNSKRPLVNLIRVWSTPAICVCEAKHFKGEFSKPFSYFINPDIRAVPLERLDPLNIITTLAYFMPPPPVAMMEELKNMNQTLLFYHAMWLCIVLYCIVLYCTVLYCIVLYCIVLYCIVLYCIVVHCIVLYCIVVHCIVLYCIVLYCIVLSIVIVFMYCIALYCIVCLFLFPNNHKSNINEKIYTKVIVT